jgi:hypothetical protein
VWNPGQVWRDCCTWSWGIVLLGVACRLGGEQRQRPSLDEPHDDGVCALAVDWKRTLSVYPSASKYPENFAETRVAMSSGESQGHTCSKWTRTRRCQCLWKSELRRTMVRMQLSIRHRSLVRDNSRFFGMVWLCLIACMCTISLISTRWNGLAT